MTSTPPAPSSAAEYIRQTTAPAVAVAATGLAIACLASPAGVLHRMLAFSSLSERFVGSIALGLTLFVGMAATALMLSQKVGAGPFLAVGAVLASVGIGVGRVVEDGTELNVCALLLGAAAGCLTGGAASMPFELPWHQARLVAVSWIVPLVACWPVTAWLVRDDSRPSVGLVVPHASGLGYLAAACVAAWSVLAMLRRPTPAHVRSYGWRDAWLAISGLVAVLCALAIWLGFDAGLRLYWLRPVIFVVSALSLAIWLLVMMVIPSPAAKIAYLTTSLLAATVPTISQFHVVAGQPVSWPTALVVAALVVGAGALVGVVLGWRHPRRSVTGGLIVVAMLSVLAWFGFASAWFTAALVAVLVGAAVAAVAGAMAIALESEAALRLVSYAFVAGLTVGLLLGVPAGWALLGDLPITPSSSRAFERVLLGLTFSATILVAAQTAVLGHRIDRRLGSAVGAMT